MQSQPLGSTYYTYESIEDIYPKVNDQSFQALFPNLKKIELVDPSVRPWHLDMGRAWLQEQKTRDRTWGLLLLREVVRQSIDIVLDDD